VKQHAILTSAEDRMFFIKRNLFLTMLCLLFTISHVHCLYAQGGDQPRLTIDAPDYDAGELWEGEDIIHTFTIKNTGKALLDITNVKPG